MTAAEAAINARRTEEPRVALGEETAEPAERRAA
jgi:hypothetical protein